MIPLCFIKHCSLVSTAHYQSGPVEILCSNWIMVLLRQLFYAIKTQLKTPKAPDRISLALPMSLCHKGGFHTRIPMVDYFHTFRLYGPLCYFPDHRDNQHELCQIVSCIFFQSRLGKCLILVRDREKVWTFSFCSLS